MESIIKSIVLGIVQGLTEFLPISSTAHLRIIPSLFHWEDPGTAFSAIIQLGTLLSVIFFFWKDLKSLYGSLISEIINKKKLSDDSKMGLWILIGTLPICIIGFLFKDMLESGAFRGLNLISFYLIFFGVVLYLGEILGKQNKNIASINLLDILLIGIMQTFALVPGASRSGVTIIGGLLLGYKRSDAAKFSFLLSIPAVLASGLLELYSLISQLKNNRAEMVFIDLFLGMFFAFLSGYWAIGFLLKYLQTHKTHVFVIYRIILGLLIVYLNYLGYIK